MSIVDGHFRARQEILVKKLRNRTNDCTLILMMYPTEPISSFLKDLILQYYKAAANNLCSSRTVVVKKNLRPTSAQKIFLF